MIVHVTDKALIERMWPTIGPLLEPAVKLTNGCYELEDVFTELMGGQQELWVDADKDNPKQINAAMTTLFDQYPRCKTLKVVFVGGKKMKRWLPEFKEHIQAYGRKNGCRLLEGFFREGWVRVWGDGARVTGVGIIKEL